MSRAPIRGSSARPRRTQPKVRVVAPQRRRRSVMGARVGRALHALPLPRDLLRRLRDWTLGLLVAAAILAGLGAMGLPKMAGMAAAHAIGRMGFVVRNVQIAGRQRVDRDAVYDIVMKQRGQDMPLVDLARMRAELLGLGWIADARVSRRLPDTLVVEIVERTPAAILQRDGALSLIDVGGHVMAAGDPRTLPMQLPLVIGDGVEGQLAALHALMETQPRLRSQVAGATWIGGRRWDLRFQSGETLALPEEDPAAAYTIFARKDASERLLGRGYAHFDMRVPGQLVVRTSREPGARIEDPPPPVAGMTPGGGTQA